MTTYIIHGQYRVPEDGSKPIKVDDTMSRPLRNVLLLIAATLALMTIAEIGIMAGRWWPSLTVLGITIALKITVIAYARYLERWLLRNPERAGLIRIEAGASSLFRRRGLRL